tara:strand:+ start:1311 stop:3905 length:2595 start_codon:yes stop_codon:yes gene_type:complete
MPGPSSGGAVGGGPSSGGGIGGDGGSSNTFSLNIKGLKKLASISPGDLIIVETPKETTALDFKDFIIGKENITFAGELTGLKTKLDDTTSVTDTLTALLLNGKGDLLVQSLSSLGPITAVGGIMLGQNGYIQNISNFYTFSNPVSTTLNFHSSGGNSHQWSSAYTAVYNNSGDWENDHTTLYVNSAKWDSTYSTTKSLSFNWEDTVSTVKSSSASWGGGSSKFTDSGDVTYLTSTGDRLIVGAATGDHKLSVLGSISASSVIFTSGGNSLQWDKVYSTVNTESGSWGGGGGGADSAKSQSTFTTVSGNSATWNWVASNSATMYEDLTVHGSISSQGILTVGNGTVGANISGDLVVADDLIVKGNNLTINGVAYTMPSDNGDAGEQLQTDGAGTLSWEAAGSGGGSGDITGVDLTGGTGITITDETNTGSGDYSSTVNAPFWSTINSNSATWTWVANNSATKYSDLTVHGAISAQDRITASNGASLSGNVQLGTVTLGTWQGTAIANSYIAANSVDGTKIALGSDAEGDIMYYNGTNYVRLGKGTDDHVLTMNGNVPNWEAASGGGGGSATSVNTTVNANSADWSYVAANSGGSVEYDTTDLYTNVSSDSAYEDVVLLLHCEEGDDTKDTRDDSARHHSLSAFRNNAVVSTDQYKYGTASLYFPAATDYLTFPESGDWLFPGDFTWEFWMRTPSSADTARRVMGYGGTSHITSGNYTHHFHIGADNYVYFYYNEGGTWDLATTTEITASTWFHVAVSRTGSTLRLFLNGTQEDSVTYSGVIGHEDEALWLGATEKDVDGFAGGYLDEVRLTKGVGRYNGNFTPAAHSGESIYQTSVVTSLTGVTGSGGGSQRTDFEIFMVGEVFR